MTAKEMMFYLTDAFPEKVHYEPASDKRLYVRVRPENLREVFKYVIETKKGRLCTMTGIDTREGIEVLYHCTFNGFPLVVTIRVVARKPAPELESVQDILKGAYWIEREIHDFLGVVFTGHPKLKRLLKAGQVPEDVYPLRKDFDYKKFRESIGEA